MKIVVIGGGTGTNTIIRGLRRVIGEQITAIVTTADSGGSTGQLRQELGVGPGGDARQALVAMLGRDNPIGKTLDHRFDRGFINGHPVGNILLAGAEDAYGSYAEAIEQISACLTGGKGVVVPVTTHGLTLRLTLPSGKEVEGELELGENSQSKGYFTKGQVPRLAFKENAVLTPSAVKAIADADLIVICSGKLYTSVGTCLMVPGMVNALRAAKAPKVYVANLMTLPGMTNGFDVVDHVEALEKIAGGKFVDLVIYNTQQPSLDIVESYQRLGGSFVDASPGQFNRAHHYQTVGRNLLAQEVYEPQPHDPLAAKRTVVRHDPGQLANLLLELFHQWSFDHGTPD